VNDHLVHLHSSDETAAQTTATGRQPAL